jgi:hypothetical protein
MAGIKSIWTANGQEQRIPLGISVNATKEYNAPPVTIPAKELGVA